MEHPVLDAFDRLVALLESALPQQAPHGALLLGPDSPPSMVGRHPIDYGIVPYASLLVGGHAALAFHRMQPDVLAAAESLRDALAQVPGLSAVFADGGLLFERPRSASKVEAPRPCLPGGFATNLRLRVWFARSRTSLAQMLMLDGTDAHTPGALRAVVAKTLDPKTGDSQGTVACTLFDSHNLHAWVDVDTFPHLLAATTTLVVPTERALVGARKRHFSAGAVPDLYSPPKGWRVDDHALVRVGRAYEAFQETMGMVPPHIQHVRMFSQGTRTCIFEMGYQHNVLVDARPPRRKNGSGSQAVGHSSSSWFAQAARAWNDLLDAFPPRSHWKAFADPRVVLYPRDGHLVPGLRGDLPLVDAHPKPGAMHLSHHTIAAWCMPARGPARLVQTHDEGPVFQVRAAHDLDAARLALRLCPVPKGKQAAFTLWDVWTPPKA